LNPLHFDAQGRRLYGVHAGGPADTGVVLVPPLGQEAVRVHRLLRVVAERLVRVGRAVMRFDPYGSGESAGDDGDLSLHTWAEDLQAADAKLRSLSGCRRTLWMGIRLGASVALQAARQQAPQALLLWEPVLDGRDYLQSLAHDHERALAYSFGPAAPARPQGANALQLGEALGFAMGERLCDELAALTPQSLAASASASPLLGLTVVAPEGHPAQAWLPTLPGPQPGARPVAQAPVDAGAASAARFVPFSHPFDWTSEEALNTALVPAEALRLLLAEVAAWR
jgi:uncharacterized protein